MPSTAAHFCRELVAEHKKCGGSDIGKALPLAALAKASATELVSDHPDVDQPPITDRPVVSTTTQQLAVSSPEPCRANVGRRVASSFVTIRNRTMSQAKIRAGPTRTLSPGEMDAITVASRKEWGDVKADPATSSNYECLRIASQLAKTARAHNTDDAIEVKKAFEGVYGCSRDPDLLFPPEVINALPLETFLRTRRRKLIEH